MVFVSNQWTFILLVDNACHTYMNFYVLYSTVHGTLSILYKLCMCVFLCEVAIPHSVFLQYVSLREVYTQTLDYLVSGHGIQSCTVYTISML